MPIDDLPATNFGPSVIQEPQDTLSERIHHLGKITTDPTYRFSKDLHGRNNLETRVPLMLHTLQLIDRNPAVFDT